MTDTVDTKGRFRARRELLRRDVGTEILILEPETTAVRTLNEMAAIVLRQCDGNTSCEEMAMAVMEHTGADSTIAAQETYRALKLLMDQGLVDAL